MDEQCVLCSNDAAVRVSGTSFCASCGLEQYANGGIAAMASKRRTRRAAILGIFSSGFLVKMLLGAVALAAVGGVAASTVMQAERPELAASTTTEAVVATTQSVATTAVTSDTLPDTLAFPEETVSQVSAAHEYAAAVQDWASCVSAAASEHSGGRFDPLAECPFKPTPPFNLAAADAPGHAEDGPGNSANTPGQADDGPGNSNDTPANDDGSEVEDDGPGKSEDAPGQNKPPKDEKDKDTDE